MEAFNFRNEAESLVNRFHIFDLEWRDCLVDQYEEMLKDQMAPDLSNVIWLAPRNGIEPLSPG